MVKKKLLIVEDEPNLLKAYVRSFEEDWDVITAMDCGPAMELLIKENPDIVMTDWNLLTNTSESLCVLCKEKNIPCMVVSGAMAEEHGDLWVTKGRSTQDLKESLNRLLEGFNG